MEAYDEGVGGGLGREEGRWAREVKEVRKRVVWHTMNYWRQGWEGREKGETEKKGEWTREMTDRERKWNEEVALIVCVDY